MLGEASELWRGAPLSDLDGWQDGRAEAARLDELRRDVEELRLEAALRAGRSLEVLAPARALVAEAPLRERRWALLALAQYQAGRQAEALSTLREVRTVLAAELALDAGPDLVALEQAILRQDPALLAERPRPDPSSTCPYQGLPPYGLDDDDRFFGREATVAAGLRRLAESGSLVVVGPSGSGKSSLVRAGLAAALRRDGRRPVVITPGARPMDALTGLSVRRGDVLVVDQCEEAFSQCADEQERSRFFRSLAEHAGRGPLVVTMRADRTGDLPAHPQFAQVVERGLFLLGPLGIEELRACIEGPAQQAGLLLEPGLVDLLLREVEDEPGALPLLSHALRETWSNREGPTLTVAGYVATGGIKGAVARTAEEVYGSVAPSQQPLVRDLMMRLVAPSGDDDPLPGRSPSRLPSRMVDDEEHRSIVELLVDARLVTVDDGVIELAHESLARNRPRLRGWLEEDVEGQRIRRHLTVAADAWESMGRPSTEVYRGVRLAQALDWRQRAQPVLTAAERAFLDESRAQVDAELSQAHARAEQERAARRRTRRFATGLAIALVVALVAAGPPSASSAAPATAPTRRQRRRPPRTRTGSPLSPVRSEHSTCRCCSPQRPPGRPTPLPPAEGCWARSSRTVGRPGSPSSTADPPTGSSPTGGAPSSSRPRTASSPGVSTPCPPLSRSSTGTSPRTSPRHRPMTWWHCGRWSTPRRPRSACSAPTGAVSCC